MDVSNPEKIDLTSSIHMKELEISLDISKAGTLILIIDACYSGTIGKAFTRIGYKQGNLILVGASRSNQSSYEIDSLGHGLFTSQFLEGLSQQPSKGEWISLQQVLSFINSKMSEIAPQHFEVVSHFENPDICIAKNPLFRLDTPAFTNEVEQLFRLSKAQIDKNSLTNFFVAKQTFGLVESKTGVFCLDNRKMEVSNCVIDNCLSLLRNLRLENKVDRGLIVTEKGINLELSQSSCKSEICKFRTIDDLVRNLMDFEPYLRRLINQFEVTPDSLRKPAIAKYFVDLMTIESGSKKPNQS